MHTNLQVLNKKIHIPLQTNFLPRPKKVSQSVFNLFAHYQYHTRFHMSFYKIYCLQEKAPFLRAHVKKLDYCKSNIAPIVDSVLVSSLEEVAGCHLECRPYHLYVPLVPLSETNQCL